MSKVVCIIPARMASTRFPGKPLAKMLGHSMIEHVYRRVCLAEHVDEVYIATCDQEIADEAERFGAQAIMTSATHTRGTDRVAEAAQKIEGDIIINVQGDEPLVDPKSLDEAIVMMKENPQVQCVNLIAPITDWEIFVSHNVVKTTIDQKGKVLYFSRQPIPTSTRESFKTGIKQIGIYFFQRDLLLDFLSWLETPLEQEEGVDMLRFLEKGITIESLMAQDMISVDTPEELFQMEKILQEDDLCKKIFDLQETN